MSHAEAREGEALVIPHRLVSPNNMATRFREIIKRAKLKPWPKLFQSLRSSCENQWKAEGMAPDTYAKLLGHSVTVSRKHYTAPTEAELDMVRKPKQAPQSGAGSSQPEKSSQKSSQNQPSEQ